MSTFWPRATHKILWFEAATRSIQWISFYLLQAQPKKGAIKSSKVEEQFDENGIENAKKLKRKPKTVADLRINERILKEYDENHQDDLFVSNINSTKNR